MKVSKGRGGSDSLETARAKSWECGQVFQSFRGQWRQWQVSVTLWLLYFRRKRNKTRRFRHSCSNVKKVCPCAESNSGSMKRLTWLLLYIEWNSTVWAFVYTTTAQWSLRFQQQDGHCVSVTHRGTYIIVQVSFGKNRGRSPRMKVYETFLF